MKLALHRSITFWSGILLMAFICWAWWDSHNQVRNATWRAWSISNGYSFVTVTHFHFRGIPLITATYPFAATKPEILPFPYFARGKELLTTPRQTNQSMTYREQVAATIEGSPKKLGKSLVPHWLLLFAVALPWSALLLWRARRRKIGFKAV
ncbi:hypothetical protein OJ996_26200 [Luteolibacter sp. GHJ8]|uniref:DUF3592 domain-containing protein n=1 Tax=Luteolibacter rhizosphaerae TaxID=2989719 RepID=A0ABT3GB80_9BACT|nr:hypothetical protein [Luteolibacter rhizosphaerae]MCW1917106.1 hypothetical protein [Luteolibacter rhizosphaerae]